MVNQLPTPNIECCQSPFDISCFLRLSYPDNMNDACHSLDILGTRYTGCETRDCMQESYVWLCHTGSEGQRKVTHPLTLQTLCQYHTHILPCIYIGTTHSHKAVHTKRTISRSTAAPGEIKSIPLDNTGWTK